MTKQLSPAVLAVWEAFNQDEAGVFVDYGDKLAAAFRAVAAGWQAEVAEITQSDFICGILRGAEVLEEIADELEGVND